MAVPWWVVNTRPVPAQAGAARLRSCWRWVAGETRYPYQAQAELVSCRVIQGWVEGVPRVTVVLRPGQSAPGPGAAASPLRYPGHLAAAYYLSRSCDAPVISESGRDGTGCIPLAGGAAAGLGRWWPASFAVLDGEPGSEPGRVLGNVVLKGCRAGSRVAEVGYWTAVAARNRGVASQVVKTLTAWAFGSFDAQGLQRVELLHQQGNLASCRVAQRSGYALIDVLPADPPAFPAAGHLHARYSLG